MIRISNAYFSTLLRPRRIGFCVIWKMFPLCFIISSSYLARGAALVYSFGFRLGEEDFRHLSSGKTSKLYGIRYVLCGYMYILKYYQGLSGHWKTQSEMGNEQFQEILGQKQTYIIEKRVKVRHKKKRRSFRGEDLSADQNWTGPVFCWSSVETFSDAVLGLVLFGSSRTTYNKICRTASDIGISYLSKTDPGRFRNLSSFYRSCFYCNLSDDREHLFFPKFKSCPFLSDAT